MPVSIRREYGSKPAFEGVPGFSIVAGGLLGSFKSNDTWKDGTGIAGSEAYIAWMLNVSLGVVR